MKDHPDIFRLNGMKANGYLHPPNEVVSQKRSFSRKGRISETRLLSVKRSIKDFFSL